MKIAIIGYGKIGREVAATAQERGHTLGLVIDLDNRSELTRENLAKVDVAIEFSTPDAAFGNISDCLEAGIPVVSGTTGWLASWEKMVALCEKMGGGLFYASNFSVGVNILFAINARLAELMNNFPEYDVSINETHHIHKLDAPSGTAVTLASQITGIHGIKKSWSLEKGSTEDLIIRANREGEAKGFHQVTYESDIDTISISHNAKSRKGFALGAVMAAEYMPGKTGIHGMKDLLKF